MPLLAKDVSCLERVENESDRQIDEHELRPRRRCVATTSTPGDLDGDEREAPAYLCTAIVKPDSSRLSKIRVSRSRTSGRAPADRTGATPE